MGHNISRPNMRDRPFVVATLRNINCNRTSCLAFSINLRSITRRESSVKEKKEKSIQSSIVTLKTNGVYVSMYANHGTAREYQRFHAFCVVLQHLRTNKRGEKIHRTDKCSWLHHFFCTRVFSSSTEVSTTNVTVYS